MPYSMTERDLQEVLEQCAGPGVISSVRFVVDKETGRKRGFGYVDFTREEEAKKVFYEMHGHVVGGRRLSIDDATRR